MGRTREQRFSEKVAETDCLIWTGACNAWGYGTFSWSPGKNINAHRAAWLIWCGEIPEGLDVLHRCNNRLCVKVEHLYLGTDQHNANDRRKAGSILQGERAWNATLTEAQVKEILRHRAGRKRGLGAQLAREYGVSVAIINNILRGDTWKHLSQS